MDIKELEAEQQTGDIEEETAAVEVAQEAPPEAAPPKPQGKPMKVHKPKRRLRRACGC